MYDSLAIENFRLFDKLTVEPLARVNLIAGDNNVGKTALLEAIWLHAGQNNPELAQRLSLWRGLPGSDTGEILAELFRGYDTSTPISITAKNIGEINTSSLTISRRYRAEVVSPINSVGLQTRRAQPDSFQNEELVFEYRDPLGKQAKARAWMETAQVPLNLPIAPNIQVEGNVAAVRMEREESGIDRANSVFLQSSGRTAPQELAARFGRAQIKGHIEDVQEVLKLLDPRLRQLIAVPVSQGPALIYADIGATRIIPVALMGSGFVRLLELALAFVEVPSGSIIIDEIENGLHYSKLEGVWRHVHQLSNIFDTQVFATTHSYECIVAAHSAFKASEFIEDFAYIRLQRNHKTQRIEGVSYDDAEAFDYAMEYGREVR